MKDTKGNKIIYQEKRFVLFFPIIFKVDKQKIEASLWPFKYSIPISEIKEINVIKKIPLYVGFGLRIDPCRKRLYFLYHHNKCVIIKRKSSFWKEIVLSVKDAERFVSLINSLIKQK